MRTRNRIRLGVIGVLGLAGVVTTGVLQTANASDRAARPAAVTASASGPEAQADAVSPTPTAASPRRPRQWQLPHWAPAPRKSPSPSATSPSSEPPSATPTQPAPSDSGSPDPAVPETGAAEQQVLNRINRTRTAAGLSPLTMSAPLVAGAHAHNLVMSAGCGLSHQCPGEAKLGERVTAQGVRWSAVAENIGMGGPVADTESAAATMAVRLTDDMIAETPPNDGHRKNILSPSLHEIGIDVIRDSTGSVWLTQDFSN